MATQRKKHSPLCFLWRTRDPVMSASQLKRLGEHKYSCTNGSLLDPFMQPWWNWLVTQLPLWMAPNLITISGLAVNIITSLILVYYSPDGKQEVPGWACLVCAIGLFIYQSLDAIDGKQARRTGSSSPLGELFDHGCDALSVALAVCVAVGLGHHPNWMFFQCFASLTLFYCAHWQTYVSGTLKFGLFDVTEAQFSIIGIHLACFVLGSSFFTLELWGTDIKLRVLLVMSISFISLNSFKAYTRAILGGGIGKNGSTVALPWLINLPAVVVPGFFTLCVYCFIAYNLLSVILRGGAGKNGSTVAGTSVLSPAIPFGLVVVPAYVIARMSEEHLYEEHPTLYIMAFGLVSAKVTNRLVVAHMTKSEMDLLDSVLWGPALLFLNQYFNTFITEYYVLWICFIWALWDLTRYCSSVCVEICDALNIELFRIAPKVIDGVGATIKNNTAAEQGTNGISKSSKHKKQ